MSENTSSIKTPVIHKLIDLSTSHITENDAKLLREDDCPVCSYEYEYGDRVIPSPNVDETEALKERGFSEAFINLYKIAREGGYELLLDCDGMVYTDLPTFNW